METSYEQADKSKPYELRVQNLFAIGDVRAAVPANSPPLVAAAAAPVVSYLNSFAGSSSVAQRLAIGPINYSFSQQQIDAARRDPNAVGLAKVFVSDLASQIEAKATAGLKEKAQQIGEEGFKSLVGWFNSQYVSSTASAAPRASPDPWSPDSAESR